MIRADRTNQRTSGQRLLLAPRARYLVIVLSLVCTASIAAAVPVAARASKAARAAALERLGPDFNGDGYADLAIGAPDEDELGRRDSGTVTVMYGSSTGVRAAGSQTWSQRRSDVRDQPEPGDRFGSALAAADFDGDGYSDLAIGVRGEDVRGRRGAGAVNVLYGSSTGLSAERDQFWTQDSPGVLDVAESGDRFGWALTAGDFDGDGFADLAIGMRFEDVNGVRDAGAVNVLYGSGAGLSSVGDQSWTHDSAGIPGRTTTSGQMAWSLASGDFDGDGRDDLAIGAAYTDVHRERAGAVHVIFGSPRGLTARGTQLWSQDSPGIEDRASLRDQFGQGLEVGDFDGDGKDDLAVGVWFEDYCWICNEGAVNVIYGSAGGLTARGDQFWNQDSWGILDSADPFDRFGHALASGDFDGDGRDDLAVGAPREALGTDRAFIDHGGVNIIYGTRAGLRAAGSQFWTQASPGILDVTERKDLFGLALGAADFDGDGKSDLAVGVRYEDVRVADAGAVHIIYGSDSGLAAAGNRFFTQDSSGIAGPTERGDHFGWTFATRSAASGTPGDSRPDYWR